GIRDRNVTGVQTCALPISSDGVISSPDQEFCTSSLYLLMLQEYLNLAESLSLNKELIKKIEKTIVATKERLINTYYHQEGYFASGSQSSYIFAVKTNLYKEKNDILVENLIKKLKKKIIHLHLVYLEWHGRIKFYLNMDIIV